MNKSNFTKTLLATGEMHRYDFGSVKLHAYKTNDPIDNEVFILEKNGKAVVVEAPCFVDNIRELTAYLKEQGLDAVGLLLSYHMAGASFLPGVPVYSTHNADDYGHKGGGAALIQNFKTVFGAAFDSSVFTVTNWIDEGPLSIAGMDFVITKTADAFDLELPQCGAAYTHMLGHDCHSIVAGAAHADAMIAQLQGYRKAGIELILTSHYTPEDLKDAETKIKYLERLKAIAAASSTAGDFKTAVKEEYPDYAGGNYLDMTAGFFFS